jgi:hypothetical protein
MNALITLSTLYLEQKPKCYHDSTFRVGLGLLYKIPQSYSDTPHPVGFLLMRNGPVAVTSSWQQTQTSEQSHIHASGGIRTRNPSKRAAALDLAANCLGIIPFNY